MRVCLFTCMWVHMCVQVNFYVCVHMYVDA